MKSQVDGRLRPDGSWVMRARLVLERKAAIQVVVGCDRAGVVVRIGLDLKRFELNRQVERPSWDEVMFLYEGR